jgi:predicted ArsR family transcriptional regulator
MISLEVIDEPLAATAVLNPVRNRLLTQLHEPASAADLALRLAIPRQKVNYHLRALESLGLVSVASTHKWGGLTERLMVSKAASFVVSPKALGPLASDPSREVDRLSARYLIALAARIIREISALLRGARDAQQDLATLSVDTVIRFRSARDRAAFTAELMDSINRLVAKHHDEGAVGGRSHRLLLFAHPLPSREKKEKPPCQ